MSENIMAIRVGAGMVVRLRMRLQIVARHFGIGGEGRGTDERRRQNDEKAPPQAAKRIFLGGSD